MLLKVKVSGIGVLVWPTAMVPKLPAVAGFTVTLTAVDALAA